MNVTADQLDALQELINIGVGRAASLLNEMVDSHIHLEIPFVKILTATAAYQELNSRFNDTSLASVKLNFTGSFYGTAGLIFPTESASALVSVLTGEEPGSDDLDAVKIGTLTEVGNIVINGVMGSISNVLKQHMNYALPVYLEDKIDNLLLPANASEATKILLAQARFTIAQLELIGDIILIFEVGTFDALIHVIDEEISLLADNSY
ncbi:chemotaxis protein CheC [Nostoc sp. FACHB-87]|uniref:chemotaxis protein CheC n=1 Tax=Nostocales TaxID=1161 RepID=UPI0016834C37|nr:MULTISPECIES: chemotaxis protein CheC [Nostocales]MBD2297864.1 chemotaxis protein CheC [Nostoc sp. FACHB-190]MBD2453980.1 chemotaxis protein CheC [Nostoc sp. FACHB-87]MBD2476105.1 chemotaxis protein CheC [Anabaena sp. FACHB-83]MBD2489772.1 chemotaxis protein CheC [Aulosira sp. FACHB-615]